MNLLLQACDHRRVRTVTRLFSLVALIRPAFTFNSVAIALPFFSFLFFPFSFLSSARLKDTRDDRSSTVGVLERATSPAMRFR